MKTFTIIEREWREAINNRLLVFSVALPALILTVLPLSTLLFPDMDPPSPEELEMFYRMDPSLRALDPMEAFQVVMINQFMLFFLIIPAMIPLVIASFSIIGEKQARSLEPLLATPIRVWELLVGKCLAAVVPSVVITWAGYVICATGVFFLGSRLAFLAIIGPLWLLGMLSLAPQISVLATSLAIIVSSRVNDTRVAQQIGAVLILPIVVVFIGQLAGKILVSPAGIMLASLALLVINVAVMYLAVRLFRRETILVNWK